MNSTKRWYRSEGVWGGVTAVGAALFQIASIVVGPTESGEVSADVSNIISAVVALLGGSVAVRGRIKAWQILK